MARDIQGDKLDPVSGNDEEKHGIIIARFNDIWSAVQEERESAKQDRRFCNVDGAQWEGELERQFENKVKIEVNKVAGAVEDIIIEQRNNPTTVDFITKDGSDNDELADVCDGLFRADVQNSGGQEAFDNAYEEGVTGGYGAIRLTAEYEDEDDDENDFQRILLEPIYDADQSVFFDLDAKRADKRDALFGFVMQSITKASFEIEFPDANATSMPNTDINSQFDWYSADTISIAEYYEIEKKTHTVHIYTLNDEKQIFTDEDFEDDKNLKSELKSKGWKSSGSKKVKKRKVHKYIVSGGEILEDCGIIAGKYIPIIPFYGKRVFIDGIERVRGHVRLAKDVQRLANIMRSKLAEISALSATEKPIVAPEQVEGLDKFWIDDNIVNRPYLPMHPLRDGNGNIIANGVLNYTKPPSIAPADAALIQIVEQDIKDILGDQQAAEEISPNVSGKAVELVLQKIDKRVALYVSNFKVFMQQVGTVWLPMAQDLYDDEDRQMKLIGSQGEVETLKIGERVMTSDGSDVSRGDLSRANFDVQVSVSPTSETKKAATVRALTGMAEATDDPATKAVILNYALTLLEGDGIDDLQAYIRKSLVAQGVIKPTDEEQIEMDKAAAAQEQQPPSPADQVLLSEAAKDQAQAGKLESDIGVNAAKIENINADTNLKGSQSTNQEAQAINQLDNVEDKKLNHAVKLAMSLDKDNQRQTVQPTQSTSNEGNPLGSNSV